MHSLKNTVIAVGLLGLSFVFYQLSEPKADREDKVAAELDAMISDDSSSVEMPSLSSDALPSLKSATAASPKTKAPTGELSEYFKQPIAGPEMPAAPELPTATKLAPIKPIATTATNQPAAENTQPTFVPPATNISTPFPRLGQPAATTATKANTLQPRPKAEFNFGGGPNELESSQPKFKENPFVGSGSKPAVAAKQRDQRLIAALQQNESQTRNSTASKFGLTPIETEIEKIAVPVQQVSAVRDISPVGAIDVSPTSSVPTKESYDSLTFQEAWPVVDKLVGENDFRTALEVLTRFYQDPTLSGPQHQRLEGWLDALATKVVFSAEHHLHPTYLTTGNESLVDLGRDWGVPGQLIYNINRNVLPNPLVVGSGIQLKKITGPINAELDLQTNTLTMFVDGLYAGRFKTNVGISGSPRPGSFRVLVKSEAGYEWRDSSGTYPPEDPKNQYGRFWMGLEGQLCIHAVDVSRQPGHLGCIGLSEKDARDLFAILAEGSTVTIK